MSILKKFSARRERALKIIIVGAGKVGSTLAGKLCAEGNNITVVDKSHELVSRITNMYDIMGITGNGSSYSTLIEAGIKDADMIIAVTDSDELNLLCCTLAKKVGSCDAVARVRNPDYSDELSYLRDKLGISMIINPELEAAKEINRIIRFPSALSVTPFAKGSFDIIKFKIPDGNVLDGMRLMDFRADNGFDVLVCAVERGKEIIIPGGTFMLRAGDVVSFTAHPRSAYKFFRRIGLEGQRVTSAIIVGGGKTSFYLARNLIQSGILVKIIETNARRCTELSELLPDSAIIINGDGTDEELLSQEDLEHTGAFIPLTGLDEQNILLSLYAMRAAPEIKAVTKVNHISFSNVIHELELGSVVYPRNLTAERIRTYARAKRNSLGCGIETLYRICNDKAEAIEFRVDNNIPFNNVPLKELSLKKDLLIAGIARSGKSFIPCGDDCFKPGDSVIIVTTHSGLDNINDILK